MNFDGMLCEIGKADSFGGVLVPIGVRGGGRGGLPPPLS